MNYMRLIYNIWIILDGEINSEAKLNIQYQKLIQYNGEKEDNDTFDTATFMKNNVQYEGNESSPEDFDYYKFEMEKPGLVNIKFKNNTSHDTITLYSEDKNGNVKELSDEIRQNRLRLAQGYYYLMVHPAFMVSTREYTIETDVTYESENEYEQENNNVKSQANEKKSNQWYTGSLNFDSDVDYFKINIDSKSYLTLQTRVPRQAADGSVTFTLCDNNMNVISKLSNTTNPYAETSEKLCSPGTYYVKVTVELDGDYSFCLNQKVYEEPKPEPKPDDKPSMRPDNKPSTEPDNKPDTKPSNNKVVYPSKSKLVSVKLKKKKVQIQWKKISNAKGYVLYRATSSKGSYKKIKTITKASTVKYTDTKVKKNKKYYYKVRAYRKASGKTLYGKFSNVKSVKVK